MIVFVLQNCKYATMLLLLLLYLLRPGYNIIFAVPLFVYFQPSKVLVKILYPIRHTNPIIRSRRNKEISVSFEVLTDVNIFWDIRACSLVEVHRCGFIFKLYLLFSACLSYFSALMKEAVFSSEMSVNLGRATWRHIAKDSNLLLKKTFSRTLLISVHSKLQILNAHRQRTSWYKVAKKSLAMNWTKQKN